MINGAVIKLNPSPHGKGINFAKRELNECRYIVDTSREKSTISGTLIKLITYP